MDIIGMATQEEKEGRLPFIAPEEFYHQYVPQADGSMKTVEWVRWIKKGSRNPTSVPMRWRDLERNPQDPIYLVLKPYYDGWKAGQTTPVNGTPLAAWPGATPQLVKVLEQVNIRSVEDLAEMEDSAIGRLSIPSLRDKQKQARAYIEARKNTAHIAGELNDLREKLAQRDNEIAELRGLIERHAVQTDSESREPRPRGRPRKIPETDAA